MMTVETPVRFSEMSPVIRMEFMGYLRENIISSGCYDDCMRRGLGFTSLVQVLSMEHLYLFEEAVTETIIDFQVIGYDDVFYWKHEEKEECPF